MKKIVGLLVIFFTIYFCIQIGFKFLDKGHELEYTVNNDNKFDIKEVFTQNARNEKNNYYFEIKVNDSKFSFQTFEGLSKKSKVIKDIKYFKNTNYECILPIFVNDKFVTDIICKKGNSYYYYNSLKNSDPELDNFASQFNYLDNYNDNNTVLKDNGNLFIYDNINKSHYVVLENYKGIYDINDRSSYKKIDLFSNETYKKEISALVRKYYITADYSKQYDFHEFKVVNLENYSTFKIISNNEISLNSYVQGVIGNSVYIFDKSNKIQYEVNVKTKKVIQLGNESIGIKYYENGKFINRNIYDTINEELLFNEYTTDNKLNNNSYARMDKVGNNLSGYYYVYEKVNNKYNVYRMDVQNTNDMIYLFQTDNIDNVYYNRNYVYFNDGVYVKYFSEKTGVKTIAKYNDLEFNKDLKIYVYIK